MLLNLVWAKNGTIRIHWLQLRFLISICRNRLNYMIQMCLKFFKFKLIDGFFNCCTNYSDKVPFFAHSVFLNKRIGYIFLSTHRFFFSCYLQNFALTCATLLMLHQVAQRNLPAKKKYLSAIEIVPKFEAAFLFFRVFKHELLCKFYPQVTQNKSLFCQNRETIFDCSKS